MKLKNHTIHVWIGSLTISEIAASQFIQTLSKEEQNRAERFQFPIHRLRFIAAHYQLRSILGKYTGYAPADIEYGYSENNKPFLRIPDHTNLQFNMSHSGDMAVYAIGSPLPLGIDIEKVQDKCNFDIADRFFSKNEIEQLATYVNTEKRIAFYRIWSRKEAIIKATGKGLAQTLPSFTVSAHDVTEEIRIDDTIWQLLPITATAGYQAALACHPSIQDIDIFSYDEISR